MAGGREVWTFRKEKEGTWPETLKRGENRKGERGKRTEKTMDSKKSGKGS